MKCGAYGADAMKSLTTAVNDLDGCIEIIRNVPCYKCTECNEILYTADVVEQMEETVESVKKLEKEIPVVDYIKWQKQRFGDMSLDELNEAAIAYEKEHPINIKK